MDFTVNNERCALDRDTILITELLSLRGITHAKGIAIAVNHEIVPQASWQEYSIKSNDKVLIITATQGG